MIAQDPSNLAFWFPRIQAAGLQVPKTHIVHTDADLIELLEGRTPTGWDDLVAALEIAGDDVGWPCFLRTGHGSGKHEWARTCFVADRERIARHVGALVEWSYLVDMFGLPTNDWAVRQMIDTAPLFRCAAFDGFPVVREFRMFVRDGKIEHTQPYWPRAAVAEGMPDRADWADLLGAASKATQREYAQMAWTAMAACEAVGGGYWSVDLLEDSDGGWWLTDMAEGERSFRYEAENP